MGVIQRHTLIHIDTQSHTKVLLCKYLESMFLRGIKTAVDRTYKQMEGE